MREIRREKNLKEEDWRRRSRGRGGGEGKRKRLTATERVGEGREEGARASREIAPSLLKPLSSALTATSCPTDRHE
uniref:Uncharacterized protein n=1 Tax=Nelumbo nucifera TaxID=4432 RepID=A0A822ZBX5_NELNU|nr:TPA_asm: hypothetical protein HUJ06_014859 [Nelumbo nucifera]